MSEIGLKVSDINKSVESKDIKDILLNSNFPFLKTFKQGEVSVSVTTKGAYSVAVTHGLGYHPAFFHFNTAVAALPTTRFPGRFAAQSTFLIAVDSYVTKSELIFTWADTSNAPGSFRTYPYVITFYYYIFYDPLENL